MRSIVSEGLSRLLEPNHRWNSRLESAKYGTEIVLELAAETDAGLLRLNEYNKRRAVWNPNCEKTRCVVGNDGPPAAHWKEEQLNRREEESARISWEKLTKKYSEPRKVVPSRVGQLVKTIGTRFGGIAVCISRVFLKCCLRKISELD